MQKQEFEKRTLDEADREHYAEWYEPAYMGAKDIDKDDFRRRLNAYWKRFGASKIHTWTYWTEA